MRIQLSGAAWRRSTRSATGARVEVAGELPDVVGVRDSTDVAGLVLAFESYAWGAFVNITKVGDLPR